MVDGKDGKECMWIIKQCDFRNLIGVFEISTRPSLYESAEKNRLNGIWKHVFSCSAWYLGSMTSNTFIYDYFRNC